MDRRTFLVTNAGAVTAAATASITTDKIATVRARFAALEHCDAGCPGWGIFEVNREPELEIERCDECCYGSTLTDDDAALLPEAQAALRKEWDTHDTWPED